MQQVARSQNLEQQARRLLRREPGSVDAVFLTRALRTFEDLVGELPKETLTAAAAAPSDFEAVLQALLAAREMLAKLEESDPLLRARLRGQQARHALLTREGGTLSAAEVAEVTGISRQAVNKRRQTGRLLALRLGRSYAYPVWQLAGNDVLPGFPAVLEALAVHDPWMQARFFLNGNPRLDGARPLEELRRGNVAAVLTAAETYGEHGAA